RQDAEPAAVDRQRFMDAELRREIRDGAHAKRAGVDRRPRARRAEVVAQLAVGGIHARSEGRIAREALESVGREAGQQRHGVVVGGPERLGVQIPEQLDDVRVPGPPQVPRQLTELDPELLVRRTRSGRHLTELVMTGEYTLLRPLYRRQK